MRQHNGNTIFFQGQVLSLVVKNRQGTWQCADELARQRSCAHLNLAYDPELLRASKKKGSFDTCLQLMRQSSCPAFQHWWARVIPIHRYTRDVSPVGNKDIVMLSNSV